MSMTMRPSVDIEFTDLSFTAGRRRIIKGITGQFRPGNLTAIMGPSGAGKSTLMNILAGYVTTGVNGSINTNGEPRRLAVFKKLSVYIMQEDILPSSLTVRESIKYAAYLKLGPEVSPEKKDTIVDETLSTLGLTRCQDTFTEKLSGGQRKRVSVAVELVNNPPVIFLDEPTTGLDVVSINSTVQLLKLLASQGRTVVATIHQPSASLFSVFDRIFMVARGRCIYQGVPDQLVPFLSNSAGLNCPQTYNVADYVFEVLQADVIEKLSDAIQNGRLTKNSTNSLPENSKNDIERIKEVLPLRESKHLDFPNSFSKQCLLLLSRIMLQKSRQKVAFWLQLIHHIFSGLIIGAIFQKVGNDASRPFDNFKFCLCVSVFYMYTHCMTPILTYPAEIKIMKREFFNRWYSLKAFYMAKTVSTIPFIVPLGILFTVIVYLMSDQPLEIERYAWFVLHCILVALTSEGLGILIGFTFNATNGAVVGPAIMAPILMLAMHGMGYGLHITQFMNWLLKASFLRFGLVGIITALYLDGRKMECSDIDEPMCFYRDARLIVRDLGMEGQDTAFQAIGLVFYLILLRVIAFFSLRYRCTTEMNNHVLVYLTKIIKRK